MYDTQKERAETFLQLATKTTHAERNWMMQILTSVDACAQAEGSFDMRKADLEQHVSAYLESANREGL